MLHKVWNSKGEMLYCFPRSSIKFQGEDIDSEGVTSITEVVITLYKQSITSGPY